MQFATDYPTLRIELTFEKLWIPEALAEKHGNGYSDTTSLAAMRAAGVAVNSTANLTWMELVDTIGTIATSPATPYVPCLSRRDPVTRKENNEFVPNEGEVLKLRDSPNRRRRAARLL